MRLPLSRILAQAGLVLSVTACTLGPPPSASSWRVQSTVGGFSEAGHPGHGSFSHAGTPGLVSVNETTAGPGGAPVEAAFARISNARIEVANLPQKLAPAGQGELTVSVGYWGDNGLRETWSQGPVTVAWELWSGDGSRESPGLGTMVTAGTASLNQPGQTFAVKYPLPEQAAPSTFGVLKGLIQLPTGKQFPFREVVTRRSPWL